MATLASSMLLSTAYGLWLFKVDNADEAVRWDMMLPFQSYILFSLLATIFWTIGCDALQQKRPIAFGSSVEKRNLGGKLKDWYLAGVTKNYMCTDTGRLVPVDPQTGHMLLKGLRKRDSWFDDLVGHSHDTEQGLCRNPTWVLPPGWTQPIPVTQFNAQYPWVTVDDRGQIRFREEYSNWLKQRAGSGVGSQTMGQPASGTSGAPAAVPDGGVGYVPPSALNVAAGTGTSSGLGQNDFGNGISAGNVAHV